MEEVPVVRNGGVILIDEINFLGRHEQTKLQALVKRLKNKYSYWNYNLWLFTFKLKHGFKLPAGDCCWEPNFCDVGIDCEKCGYQPSKCLCGYSDPCKCEQ